VFPGGDNIDIIGIAPPVEGVPGVEDPIFDLGIASFTSTTLLSITCSLTSQARSAASALSNTTNPNPLDL
jgi:hypothetical protein